MSALSMAMILPFLQFDGYHREASSRGHLGDRETEFNIAWVDMPTTTTKGACRQKKEPY